MTTYPLPTLAAQITSAGISAPSYQDILLSLQASFRLIYGSDIDIDSDTQDGQMIAVFATAINDSNNAIIATYNSFSPSFAQGVGLSSNVKLNAIRRKVPSNSQAVVTVVGTFGTVINNGLVGDNQGLGTQWALPPLVNIPFAGTIDVTATCTTPGAVAAAADTLTQILSPTRGWQSVNNALDAVPGQPVETDSALRQRRDLSIGLPSVTPLQGISAALAQLTGVVRFVVYENDTGATDSNGIPAHSISAVVEGGDVTEIAQTIFNKKNPGTGTYGSTSETVTDPAGQTNTIHFYVLALQRIVVDVTLTRGNGWVGTTAALVQASIANYINSLAIGQNVNIINLKSAATLYNGPLSSTFEVTALTAAIYPGSPGGSDITIPFNEAASGQISDVSVTLV